MFYCPTIFLYIICFNLTNYFVLVIINLIAFEITNSSLIYALCTMTEMH